MSISLLTIEICYEQDVVLARQRSRQIAQQLGFDTRQQVWLATAVSEIARNAFQYGGGGRVEFRLEENSPQQFVITIRDQGPGISNLTPILNGQYTSATGMGLGIVGARRLMDTFEITSAVHQGTTVVMGKFLPRRNSLLAPALLTRIAEELSDRFALRTVPKELPQNPYEEIQQQNQELLRTLEELRKREDELSQLNQELEDTNRGVVALYAELDEKAESLQKANEIKTRFLSNMSHEFRTPVNSILSLTRILLDRLDGDLTSEQEKQVNFIRKAAEGLSELVNDLLDLAKVEAGKVEVRASWFEVNELFGTLRGMLRPLMTGNPAVALVFVESAAIPPLFNDDGKVAQILRNFISNALKFTEQGEVRVSAEQQGDRICFKVEDTGIGIAPLDQKRIFEDFVQIDSHRQRLVKGTGLGLPLSRRLAELLGGDVVVSSQLGQGSTFIALLPIRYSASMLEPDGAELKRQAISTFNTSTSEPVTAIAASVTSPDSQPKLLLIDDDSLTHYLVKQALSTNAVTILTAQDGPTGLAIAQREQPQVIVLDLAMPTMEGYEVLVQLKQHPITNTIPVIIQTSRQLEPAEIEQLKQRAIAVIPKGTSNSSALLTTLAQAGFNFVGETSYG